MQRKKRPGLNQQLVVQKALECLQEEGLKGLGVNRVARALGIKPPSLYNHVKGNDDLQRLVAIEGWRIINQSLSPCVSETPGEKDLVCLAEKVREFALQNPEIYQLCSSVILAPSDPDFQPVAQGIMQIFATVFGAFGLSEQESLHATRFARSTIHGFVMLELAGQFQMDFSVDESYKRLIRGLVEAIKDWERPSE